MGLIKSNLVPTTAASFSMADIERHAKAVLLRAQRQAEALLIDAQAEGEAIKAQARVAGLAQGRQAGLAQGLEQGTRAGREQALEESRGQLAQAVQALSAAMASLDASRADLESQALAEVAQLAIAIARRVTKRQALIDPAVLAGNLADAMRLVVRSTDVRIAIHPSQRAALDDAMPRLKLQWPTLAHVAIDEDPSLAPGGCRLHTPQGRIDADLDGQLDRIAAELLPSAAPLS